MTPAELYQAMALPPSAKLGKRIFKKLFLEHANLTPADKRALSEEVDHVVWQYALKPDTSTLKPYVDAEREYLEIAILEAHLTSRRSAKRLSEIIHRAIPYPVVLVLSEGDAIALSIAHKRKGHAAIVSDTPTFGPWLEGVNRTPSPSGATPAGAPRVDPSSIERAFLDHLMFSALPQTHAFDLYSAIATRVLALVISEVTGRFTLPDPHLTPDAVRLERLAQCRALEREVTQTRAELRAESSFAKKVDLNVRIKSLEQRLAALTTTL